MKAKVPEITQLRFVSLHKAKIAAIVVIVLVVEGLALLKSITAAVGLPLVIVLALARLAKKNQKARMALFYQEHEWGHSEADYLAIYTEASREGGRHSDPKIFIEKIRSKAVIDNNQLQLFNTQQSSLDPPTQSQKTVEVIFAFQDILYRATADSIERMTEYHKLKLLDLGEIEPYLLTGLTDQLYALSKQYFGDQIDHVTPSFWNFFIKNVVDKSGMLLCCFAALLLTLEINPEVVGIPAILVGCIVLLIVLTSAYETSIFSEEYSWVQERAFTVVRKGEKKQLKVTELMVGDVVLPDTSDKEYVFWFGAVLAGQVELIVREGEEEALKVPLRETGGLQEKPETLEERLEREELESKEAQLKQEQQILGIVEKRDSKINRKDSRLKHKDSGMSPLKGSRLQRKDSKLSPLKEESLIKHKQSRFNPKESKLAGLNDSTLSQKDSRLLQSPHSIPLQPTSVRANRHSIAVHSRVDKGRLRQGERFLVIDHCCISIDGCDLDRYFRRWFQKDCCREFQPLTKRYWRAAWLLTLILVGVAVALYLALSLIKGRSLVSGSALVKNTVVIISWGPLLVFLISDLFLVWSKAALRDICWIFGQDLLQAGVSRELVINFSRLLHLQFEQTLPKNKLLGFQTEVFEPSAQTLKNGITYESLLAVILYLSLGHFDDSTTLLSRVYSIFQTYYEYKEGFGDYPDIVHPSGGKQWELLKLYPENEEGIRSWMVQFDNKTFYLITEVGELTLDCFRKLGEKEDSRKKETYLSAAKELRGEGKALKTMFFRNLKEERLTESVRPEGNYAYWSRQTLQKNLQFGCYLVFDHALYEETVEQIETLKTQEHEQLVLSFLSAYDNEQLAGFEHLLTDIPFYYGVKQEGEVGRSVRSKMEKSSTVYLGGGTADLQALALADLTLRVKCQNEQFCLPADVWLKEEWKVTNLSSILQTGRDLLDTTLELIRLVLVAVAMAVMAQIYFDRWHQQPVSNQGQQMNKLFFGVAIACLAPIVFRVIMTVKCSQRNQEIKGIFTFSYILALVFTTVAAVVVIMFAEGHSACSQHHQPPSLLRHLPTSGEYCQDLVLFLSTMGAVMVFGLFYGGHYWLQEEIVVWRLVVLVVWGVAMVLMGYSLELVVAVVVLSGELLIVKMIVGHFRR